MATANLSIGKPNRHGLSQMYILLVHKGYPKYIRLFLQVQIKYFDRRKMECKFSHDDCDEINDILDKKLKLARKALRGPEVNNKDVNEIENMLIHTLSGSSGKTFLSVMEEITDLMKKEDRESSANIYRYAFNQLVKFLGKQPSLEEVNYDVLLKFKTHCFELGRTKSTITTYLSLFSAVINHAVRKGYISSNTAMQRGLTPGQNETESRAFGVEVIRRLERERPLLKGDERLIVNAVLLQFYLHGNDFVDVLLRRKDEIKNGYVRFIRRKNRSKKNDIWVQVKLLPKALEIINESKGDYFLNVTEEQVLKHTKTLTKLSPELHNVLERLGLPKFGVKAVRSTYAKLARKTHKIPEELREVAQGHRRSGMQKVYDGIEQSEIDEVNALVVAD